MSYFWDTAGGQRTAEILQRTLPTIANMCETRQYTKVCSEEEVGNYIEEEIGSGSSYVATVPYKVTCKEGTVKKNMVLVIMEKKKRRLS